MKQNTPQCPNCSNYQTLRLRSLFRIIGVLFMVGGMVTGFLILPLLLVPCGFVLLPASFFVKKNKYWCRFCNYQFKI